MSQAILLLARAPSAPGKTRLTAGHPHDEARALREALLLDTLEVARSLGVPLMLCYTPDEAREELAQLAGDVTLLAQSGDHLGARMLGAIAFAFDQEADRLVLLGSDLPTLPPEHIREAFTALANGADCVLGPSDDGGYYLVGVARHDRRAPDVMRRVSGLFGDIPWGTSSVLAASCAAAADAGLTHRLVSVWYDVDVPLDLDRVAIDPRPDVAPRTRAWVARNRPR